ncbi:hypothetical protein LOZ55_001987 [Ophidiomyces ophidiicola]|nr:hypothetical protein LOZ55_001987 [Ophidiomyces ophidiicola]
MPTVNGDVPHMADGASPNGPPKRKHEPAVEQTVKPDTPTRDSKSLNSETVEDLLTSSLKDVLEVVRKYDDVLKMLDYPLPPNTDSEPDNKRTKLSEQETKTSISSKVASGEYRRLQDFNNDIELVTTLVSSNDTQSQSRPQHLKSLSPDEISAKANLFNRQLNDLLQRSNQLRPLLDNSETEQAEEGSSFLDSMSVPTRDDLPILTVTVGNPSRTYFSSFPLIESPSGPLPATRRTPGNEQPPVDESLLPENIKVSKVVPFNSTNFQGPRGRIRTFGEVFGPPANLPQLKRPCRSQPPKKSDNVIGWLKPVDVLAAASTTPSGHKLYNNNALSVGDWLNYGKAFRINVAASANSHEISQMEEEDVGNLMSACSSFAPSYDSGGAVVDKDSHNMVFWDRYWSGDFHQLYSKWHQDQLEPVRMLFENTILEPEPLDDAGLQEAVESFKPSGTIEEFEKSLKASATETGEAEVEQILEEISGLLQTLQSYRRLRVLQPVPGQLSNVSSSASNQSSDTPSDQERALYDVLKQSLSSMIAMLPPYAVAKLNGDQLAELNISTTIKRDGLDFAGTMDEDEWTVRQKQASRPALPVNRSPVPTHPPRGPIFPSPQHPNIAPHQRYQPPPPRTRNATTNFHNAQAYGARPPLPGGQYQPGHPPHAYSPSPQPSQRFVQPPYQQPTPAAQYTRTGMLQQFQRPSPGNPVSYGGQRNFSPSQPSQQSPYPRPVPPASYPPRPNASSPPHRPTAFSQPPQRQPYLNSASVGTQPRYFQQQAQPPAHYANYPSNQSTPTPAGYPPGAAGMPFPRGSADQANMPLDRTRTPTMEAQRRVLGLSQQHQQAVHQGNTQGNPPATQPQLTPRP